MGHPAHQPGGEARPLLRATRIALTVATLAMFGVLLAQAWSRAHRPDGYDLTSYLLSAKALLHGANPFATDTPFPYIYPLFLAFVLVPLTFVPAAVAHVLWFVAGVAALLAIVRSMLDLRADGAPADAGLGRGASVALACLLLAPVIQSNLVNGQANLLVVLACVLFFRAERRGQGLVAAAWLAAAIAIKLTPAILLLYLLGARRFRTLAMTLALTAAFALAPALVAGGRIVTWYRGYLDGFIVPHLVPHAAAAGVTGMSWPEAAPVRAAIAALVLAVLVVARRRTRDAGALASEARLFALHLAAALALSPMLEPHHLALAIPGAILAGTGPAAGPRWTRWAGRALVALFWLAIYAGAAMRHGPFPFIAVVALVALLALWPARGAQAPTID